MSKKITLNSINQTLLLDLIEIRNKLKKSILKKFDADGIDNQEILDTVSVFMEVSDKIDQEVNARLKAENIKNMFSK